MKTFILLLFLPTLALAKNELGCATQASIIGVFDVPRTVGIEVEAVIPKGMSYAQLQRAIAYRLRSIKGVTNVHTHTGFRSFRSRFIPGGKREHLITFLHQGKAQIISLGQDFTINPPKGMQGVEIRSPILSSDQQYHLFMDVLNDLVANHGLQENPLSAGLHVHVGAEDFTPRDHALAARVMSNLEPALMKFFNVTEPRQAYNRPIAEELVLLAERNGDIATLTQIIEASKGRHRTLNFGSVRKFGTLEWRLFNSTVNVEQITFLADFSVKLTDAIKRRDPAVLTVLRKPFMEVSDLEQLFAKLNMKVSGSEVKLMNNLYSEASQALERRYHWMSPELALRFREAGVVFSIIGGTLAHTAYYSIQPVPTPSPSPSSEPQVE